MTPLNSIDDVFERWLAALSDETLQEFSATRASRAEPTERGAIVMTMMIVLLVCSFFIWGIVNGGTINIGQ